MFIMLDITDTMQKTHIYLSWYRLTATTRPAEAPIANGPITVINNRHVINIKVCMFGKIKKSNYIVSPIRFIMNLFIQQNVTSDINIVSTASIIITLVIAQSVNAIHKMVMLMMNSDGTTITHINMTTNRQHNG